MKQIYCWIAILGLMGSMGCVENPGFLQPRAGVLPLERYVALGDGYTAGLSDASLEPSHPWSGWYPAAQAFSFPQLLAQQFSLAKRNASFLQPPLPESGTGHLILQSMSPPLCDFLSATPVISWNEAAPTWSSSTNVADQNDQMGLPALRPQDLSLPQYAQQNPPWAVLGGTDGQSYLDMVATRGTGFFSVMLGLETLIHTLVHEPDSLASFPSQQMISQIAELLETCLAVDGSYGMVANLPDPSLFPYFSQVAPQFVAIENCQGGLKSIYITNSSGEVVEAGEQDRIFLPAAPLLGTNYNGPGPFGLSRQHPVPRQWVLDGAERSLLLQRIQVFNHALDSLVQDLNNRVGRQRMVVVDLHHSFFQLADGIVENGLSISPDYLSGGIFSLDGLYFTPRGNAWLANAFIQTINKFGAFGARIPPLDLTAYPGIRYP